MQERTPDIASTLEDTAMKPCTPPVTGASPADLLPLERHCPVAATLRLMGGKYKALILWKLMEHSLRFSELRREVPCATPKMLTQQLRELEADGLLSRKVYPVVPPRVEYSLTDFGRSIRPVLEAMGVWGSAYLARLQQEEARAGTACPPQHPA